ncbi:exo-alpha-sialidase [Inquilinus sp. Marseille-Q2685]|uniref:sialidase family protein n=1 Tax=Inquilinus sp. Marseille-Q2685 TaxID=2866581 RepID=UPI001CE4A946|nr:exo-alpha-sialidase [Inquilinus sp. Marseille-Q2685]
MSPDEIAARMTGVVAPGPAGRLEAFLPSPVAQNHAAFLAFLPDGSLACAWFGGTIEGASDISIHVSTLAPGAAQWAAPRRMSGDPARSEQNPVIFVDPDGRIVLVHTAQPAGNQDECLLRWRTLVHAGGQISAGPARELDLPRGTFVRAPIVLRDDGAWMMPVFRCVGLPGRRWTGSHDTSALAVSRDRGETWQLTEVPGSVGSVHMTVVPLGGGRLAAFYRRRQADFVHRSDSADGGRTWSAPRPTDVPNNNSSIGAIRLSDGRIALLCNPSSAATSQDRRRSLYDEIGDGGDARPDAEGGCSPVWGVPRAPLALCVSEDEGRSFPLRRIVEDGPGTCLTNNSLDGRNSELSYPALVEGPDGALHLAFTWHRRAIKYVRLAPGWIDGRGA